MESEIEKQHHLLRISIFLSMTQVYTEKEIPVLQLGDKPTIWVVITAPPSITMVNGQLKNNQRNDSRWLLIPFWEVILVLNQKKVISQVWFNTWNSVLCTEVDLADIRRRCPWQEGQLKLILTVFVLDRSGCDIGTHLSFQSRLPFLSLSQWLEPQQPGNHTTMSQIVHLIWFSKTFPHWKRTKRLPHHKREVWFVVQFKIFLNSFHS